MLNRALNVWVFLSKRVACAAVGVLCCLFGIWNSARIGWARWLATVAAGPQQLAAAAESVRWSAADPVTHSTLAARFLDAGRIEEAISESERAVALRPEDYRLWLELGILRDRAGDTRGALAALTQAVRQAPYYSLTHSQLGGLLLKSGRREEGLRELYNAVQSDPATHLSIVDLVWRECDQQTEALRQVSPLETPGIRLALARFLLRRGRVAEAVALFDGADRVAGTDRSVFLEDLLAAKYFHEAYAVWAVGRMGENSGSDARTVITNGSFENKLGWEGAEFEWRFARAGHSIHFALDADRPRHGAKSLRIDFGGNIETSASILSQLVISEPRARYRLRFAARTKDLVTGGLPVVAIVDAAGGEQLLAESIPLRQEGDEWRDYQVTFETPAKCTAMRLILRRQHCAEEVCPIFGHLWLDAFVLESV